jgi:hypothetical protein
MMTEEMRNVPGSTLGRVDILYSCSFGNAFGMGSATKVVFAFLKEDREFYQWTRRYGNHDFGGIGW